MRKFNNKSLYHYLSYALLIIINLFVFSTSVNASNIFNSDSYSLPVGKDMLLWPSRTACNNMNWKSENKKIATVDSYGVVHAKSIGTTEIFVNDNKNKIKASCTLNITQPEPVRSTYITPGLPTENEKIIIYALTPKNSESVKFIITAHNYKKEIISQKKTNFGDLYLWQAELSSLKSNNYKIETFSKINKHFKSCKDANLEFKVSSFIDKSSMSTKRRELSKDGANFIIRQEGFVSHVYKDVANFLTIGYGKSIYPYQSFYNNLNKEEGYQDFLNKIKSSGFENSVNNLLAGNNIKFNQHQFDALVSFSYNVGGLWTKDSYLRFLVLNSGKQKNSNCGVVNSTDGLFVREHPTTESKKLALLHYGNKVAILDHNKKNEHWYNIKTSNGIVGYCYGDYITLGSKNSEPNNLNYIHKEEFINEFLNYHHSGRQCYKGLLYRRIKELEIFLNGNYNAVIRLNKYPIPICIKKFI